MPLPFVHLPLLPILKHIRFLLPGLVFLSSYLHQHDALAWFPLLTQGRCKQTGTQCYTTLGNAGGKSACCDPQTSSDCPSKNPCEGSFPHHWPTNKLPIQWNFNPNGMIGKEGFANLTSKAVEQAIIKAWDAWKQPCATFNHKYQGITTQKPNFFDEKITLYFPSKADWALLGIGDRALAFSMPRTDQKGNLLDGDILFHPFLAETVLWGLRDDIAGRFDLQGVATHEIGHSLGFAHSNVEKAVMYYQSRPPGTTMDPVEDDIKGICSIYPKQQGSCKNDQECGHCHRCNQNQCTPIAPNHPKICAPCIDNQSCGPGQQCIPLTFGRRCLSTCASDLCCPQDFRCTNLNGTPLCTPKLSHCPSLSCPTQPCPTGEICINSLCLPNSPPHHKLCNQSCTSHADCGDKNRCMSIGTDQKRCLLPCTSNTFCPNGYVCRQTPDGRLCMPQDQFFCPCTHNADCETGKICRNQLCQLPNGGSPLDLCNERAPCANGLTCLRSSSGSICVIPCGFPPDDSKCPKDFTCKQYSGHLFLCTPKGTKGLYETCEPKTPCRDDLICSPNSPDSWKGTCVQNCNTTTTCTAGGTCTKIDENHSVCKCDQNNPCAKGYTCQLNDDKTQTGVCICKEGACKAQCGDNKCEPSKGENCASCPKDCTCPSDQSCLNGACNSCGNAKCEAHENCSLCPSDCKCQPPLSCNQGACTQCGDGKCEPSKGENCKTCPNDCKCQTNALCGEGICVLCGDGICQPNAGENCTSCPNDCTCPSDQSCQQNQCQKNCGNGACQPNLGENCTTCPADCPCPTHSACQTGQCISTQCGNGQCELNAGENCFSCPKDCTCHPNQTCFANACLDKTEVCQGTFKRTCDDQGKNCQEECIGGCGCQSQPTPQPNPLHLLSLLLLLALFRSVRHTHRP